MRKFVLPNFLFRVVNACVLRSLHSMFVFCSATCGTLRGFRDFDESATLCPCMENSCTWQLISSAIAARRLWEDWECAIKCESKRERVCFVSARQRHHLPSSLFPKLFPPMRSNRREREEDTRSLGQCALSQAIGNSTFSKSSLVWLPSGSLY